RKNFLMQFMINFLFNLYTSIAVGFIVWWRPGPSQQAAPANFLLRILVSSSSVQQSAQGSHFPAGKRYVHMAGEALPYEQVLHH
ncbi:MAG: hypothetical protein ACI83P_000766, partial [Janthinobacterium sp.]